MLHSIISLSKIWPKQHISPLTFKLR